MKQRTLIIVAAALLLQLMLLCVAYFVGVLTPAAPESAKLVTPAGNPMQERMLQQNLDQQLAQLNRAAESQQQAMTQALLDAAQPMPDVPRPQVQNAFAAMSALLPVSGSFASAGDVADVGGDAGAALPPAEAVTFMGETLNATRIVLLLDLSASVKTKLERSGSSLEVVRTELLRFLDQLGPNHLFGIVLFTRNQTSFRSELLPATEIVKAEARDWIRLNYRTDGTSGRGWLSGSPNGIEAVLNSAFALHSQINEIFLLSDCDFYRTPSGGGSQRVPWPQIRNHTKHLQEQNRGTARLRVLAFLPPENIIGPLREWVRENGNGSLRIVDGS